MSHSKPAAPAAEMLAYFDGLEMVKPSEMTGLWRGRGMPSGHPLDGVLENLGWFGKRFHADGRADALLFQFRPGRLTALDPSFIPLSLALRLAPVGRTGFARNLFSYLQKALRASGTTASVRASEFRGQSSAAMIYDRQPVTDVFRRIGEDRLLGLMSVKDDPRYYYFTLTRVEHSGRFLAPEVRGEHGTL